MTYARVVGGVGFALTVHCCGCRKPGLWNKQWQDKDPLLPAAEDAFRKAFRDEKGSKHAQANALRDAIQNNKLLQAWLDAEVKQHSAVHGILVHALLSRHLHEASVLVAEAKLW